MLCVWVFALVKHLREAKKKMHKSPGCKYAFLTEEVTNTQQYLHVFTVHVVDPCEAVAARGMIKYTWKSMVSCLY